MRVLVDASALGDDSAQRGIGTFLRNLLTELATHPELSVLALSHAGAPLPAGIERVTLHRAAPGRFRSAEHELLLPLDLRRHGADVVHSPGLHPPRRSPLPWVQTLHDVIPLLYDDPELATERRRFQRQAARLRRARTVVAVSRHTADTAIATLGLDPRRVEVIPHGVDPRYRPAIGSAAASTATPAPAQTIASAPAQPPYLLSVGEYSRRKGYPEAFAVIGALGARGYPHRLHVTGRIAPWVRPTVDRLVATAPDPRRIVLRGFVEDLVGEYQRADVLISSSRYEGFGFPAVEAMACGTPVVAFANSAVTEVVGDAGLLVPDGDTAAMTAAVASLLEDPGLRSELVARGLERARRFNWADAAAAYAEVFGRAG